MDRMGTWVERNFTNRVLPPHLDWPCLALAGGLAAATIAAGVLAIVGWADSTADNIAGAVVAAVLLVMAGVVGLVVAVLGGVREFRNRKRFG